MMSGIDVEKAENFADRISDHLSPIHRGAIQIGPNKLAIFGNDGHSAPGVAEIAQKMFHWLAFKGWNPLPVEVCADSNTWVIVATPNGDIQKARRRADMTVWKVWNGTPNQGRTARHAGGYQFGLAQLEIAAIGGGYTDDTLETPLAGKGGPVRGDILANGLMLDRSASGEDVYILLGGVPFPAKILQSDLPNEGGFVMEVAVLTEDVGDPRSDGEGTATAFLPAGHAVVVRHFGEIHETTGNRILIPVHIQTGERLPD
jgi:hypothetical protein